MTIEREEPALTGLDERTSLRLWLDYHRATLLWKCEGLTAEQLAERSVPPSTMSLLGLVRHMTEVERGWFLRTLAGEDAPPLYYDEHNRDGDFDDVDPARRDDDFAMFQQTLDRCRSAEAAVASLDDNGKHHHRDEGPVSLRWIMVHMIEEYARHNGHADLLRECIDGATGD